MFGEMRNGSHEAYYRDGQIQVKYTCRDNELNGPYEYYHRNGQVKVRCVYTNNRRDGLYEEFYENGQLKIKCEYTNSQKNGLYEEFYENGQLKIKCKYKDGQKDGLCEENFGKKSIKYTCDNGKIDGLCEEYDEAGKLVAIRYFIEDKEVNEEKYIFEKRSSEMFRSKIREKIKAHKDAIRTLVQDLTASTPERKELAQELMNLRKEHGFEIKKHIEDNQTIQHIYKKIKRGR